MNAVWLNNSARWRRGAIVIVQESTYALGMPDRFASLVPRPLPVTLDSWYDMEHGMSSVYTIFTFMALESNISLPSISMHGSLLQNLARDACCHLNPVNHVR